MHLSQPSIYATESGGTWGPVVVIPGSLGDYTTQVSCTSAGNCTAVGNDTNNEPFYVTESGGTWGAITEISIPAGDISIQLYEFNSVTCTSATDCTAVGDDGSGPFYASESGGTWGPARGIADAGGGGMLYGVSCTDATDCTAVGGDNDGLSYATESSGIWGSVADIGGTSADGAGNGGLYGVSCTSATDCTAVGNDGNFEPIYTSTVPVSSTIPSGTKLDITTPSLPSGAVGVPYSASVTAARGNPPYTWKLAPGSKLPKGLKLAKSTGTISGTPKNHDSGTYTFTVKVLDKKIKTKHHPATQNTASAVLSITIVNSNQALTHLKRR